MLISDPFLPYFGVTADSKDDLAVIAKLFKRFDGGALVTLE